jgi:tetratricopeptide (TPR) repeat protein
MIIQSLESELALQATDSLRNGNLAEAERLSQEALASDASHPMACFVQGSLFDQRGQKFEAIGFLRRALERDPGNSGLHHYLGVVLHSIKESTPAETSLREAVRLNPTDLEIRLSLGKILLAQKKFTEARETYSQCLRLCQNHPAALEGLGDLSLCENRKPAAEHFYRSALRAGSSSASLLNKLANLLAQRGLSVEAEECYRQALALDPRFADAHFNLGSACGRAGRAQEALHHLRQAVALKPSFKEAWETLAMSLEEGGNLREALDCWERVLQLDAGWIKGRWACSLTLLKMGRLLEGWASYEYRLKIPELIPPRDFNAPLWTGQTFHQQTLLITAEQGLGDTIQFIRYVSLVKARGGTVVVECQAPLANWLESCSGIDQVIASGQPLPYCDWHVSLMSLPHIFQTTLETIPSEVPYLRPLHPVRREPGKLLQVGLVWAGSPKHQRDRMRSCRFEELLPLLETDGVQWVSLQKEIPLSDRGPVEACEHLKRVSLDDFAATADQVSALDLVISVDTSVAHLAGSLNVPVWILLARASDWRWLLDRDNSPWYPSARLFRQQQAGDWNEVIRQVREELKKKVVSGERRVASSELPLGR